MSHSRSDKRMNSGRAEPPTTLAPGATEIRLGERITLATSCIYDSSQSYTKDLLDEEAKHDLAAGEISIL